MYKNADPRLTYFVLNKVDLARKQEQVLTRLYQPLIGPIALSLYLTLINDYQHVPIKSQGKKLYQLQEILDIKLEDIFNSLHKLEATGLVKTFHGEMLGVGDYLAFQLVDVPEASEFFKTLLLSSLLLEKVGTTSFQNLNKEFNPTLPGFIKEGKDVSADFFDVFHLSAEKAINPDEQVLNAANLADQKATNLVRAKMSPIDWNFVKDLFSKYGISADEVDSHAGQMAQLMHFYGLSEQDFVNQVATTIVAGQDQLNIKQMQYRLNELATQNQSQKQIAQAFKRGDVKNNSSVDLNQSERELLEMAKSLTPLKFLETLKLQKGGFVTYNERNVIRRLQLNYNLPDAWVNILIKTCLDYDSVLSDNITGRIANSWLQHQVTTPEAALEFTREWQKRKVTKTRKKRVEQGTDWKKKIAQDKINKEASVGSADEQDLSEIMKNLQKFDPKD
ncbi:DnaD domain protein [Lactobacillus mulieris]|nr:DnaD domain protein [Lactobacillus mulieris]